MGAAPTKRMTPTAEEPNSPPAEAVPHSDAAAIDLSREDIRELRAFFLLLDRWDRELHEQ